MHGSSASMGDMEVIAPRRLAQAAVVPFQVVDGAPRWCLITSLAGRRWGLPKGLVDPGETTSEAALREAHEEAGLCGRLIEPALGNYEYAKWGAVLEVEVYLMEVLDQLDQWPERAARRRRWVLAEEAIELLSREGQILALREAMERVANHSSLLLAR
jgi:phosphohistidine phosphatase